MYDLKTSYKLMKIVMLVVALVCFLFLPLSLGDVVLGGGSATENVTLINPDDSTFTFNSGNVTTYDYVGNYPDGWWMFIGGSTDAESDFWVIGVIFAFVAIGVCVALITMRKKKRNEIDESE